MGFSSDKSEREFALVRRVHQTGPKSELIHWYYAQTEPLKCQVATYPALEALLKRRREVDENREKQLGEKVPWVFHRDGGKIVNPYKAWRSACRRAGLEGKTLHDFRRTAVRNLERAGVPRSVAMQLTGHRTESVYSRYDIVDEQDLQDGIARLAKHFGPHLVPTQQETAP